MKKPAAAAVSTKGFSLSPMMRLLALLELIGISVLMAVYFGLILV